MKQKNKINFNIFVVLIVPLLSPLQIPRIPAKNFPYRYRFYTYRPSCQNCITKKLLPANERKKQILLFSLNL